MDKQKPDRIVRKIIDDLKNNKAIKIDKTSEVFGAIDDDFSYPEEELGIVFSSDIKSVYKAVNGVNISWKYEDKFYGEINMLGVAAVTQGFYDDFWKDERKKKKAKDDKTFYEFCRSLNSLDVFEDTFDGTLRTVFQFQPDTKEPQNPPLWLWNLAGEKYPLSLDFTQYWQMLAKTRGFAGWPYFFIDLRKCRFEDAFFKKYFSQSTADALPFMEKFLKTMPVLFPQDDFTEFEALYRTIAAAK